MVAAVGMWRGGTGLGRAIGFLTGLPLRLTQPFEHQPEPVG